VIVNQIRGLVGSHYFGMTVMVPDSELGNYMYREIRKLHRDPREFIPMIQDAKLPPREKENLFLNVRIALKDRRANENARPD
jgi:hypothetical protein